LSEFQNRILREKILRDVKSVFRRLLNDYGNNVAEEVSSRLVDIATPAANGL